MSPTNSRVKASRESIAEIEKQQSEILQRNIELILERLPQYIAAKDLTSLNTPANCLRKCDMFLNALTKGKQAITENRNDALNLAACAILYAAKL